MQLWGEKLGHTQPCYPELLVRARREDFHEDEDGLVQPLFEPGDGNLEQKRVALRLRRRSVEKESPEICTTRYTR